MTDRLAEDMERLLDWRLDYMLAYPKTREWLKLLRTAEPGDLPHLARAITADSDEAPKPCSSKSCWGNCWRRGRKQVRRYRCKLCNLPIRDPDEHLKHEHRLFSFSEDACMFIEVTEDGAGA
jgi:hypothetical protein